jgi:hypothetical protein
VSLIMIERVFFPVPFQMPSSPLMSSLTTMVPQRRNSADPDVFLSASPWAASTPAVTSESSSSKVSVADFMRQLGFTDLNAIFSPDMLRQMLLNRLQHGSSTPSVAIATSTGAIEAFSQSHPKLLRLPAVLINIMCGYLDGSSLAVRGVFFLYQYIYYI